jgi:hypothetical protein
MAVNVFIPYYSVHNRNTYYLSIYNAYYTYIPYMIVHIPYTIYIHTYILHTIIAHDGTIYAKSKSFKNLIHIVLLTLYIIMYQYVLSILY